MTLIYYVPKFNDIILHHVDYNIIEMASPKVVMKYEEISMYFTDFSIEAELIGEL